MAYDKVDVVEINRGLQREPDLTTAAKIMQWELGDFTKSITYMDWHTEDLHPVYRIEAKLALASLLFQARIALSLLNLDLDEVLDMGVQVVRERIEDKVAKRGRFSHFRGEAPHNPYQHDHGV